MQFNALRRSSTCQRMACSLESHTPGAPTAAHESASVHLVQPVPARALSWPHTSKTGTWGGGGDASGKSGGGGAAGGEGGVGGRGGGTDGSQPSPVQQTVWLHVRSARGLSAFTRALA